MKTFKFSRVLCTRENTDVFIALDENIYGIHSKRVNILYISLFLFDTKNLLDQGLVVQWAFFATTAFGPKDVAIKTNLLL